MGWLERIFKKTTPTVKMASAPEPEDFAHISDAPGSSLWALSRRQEALGEILRAKVYAYNAKTLLITSITRHAWFTENGVPSVLPIEASNEDLGRAVCEHLAGYTLNGEVENRNTKRSDWPVFQASGAKSMKGFESKSHIISVSTLYDRVEMEAAPCRRNIDGFCVKGKAAPVHEDVGACVRRLLKGVEALREKGLM